MSNDKVIEELLSRIQALEEKVIDIRIVPKSLLGIRRSVACQDTTVAILIN